MWKFLGRLAYFIGCYPVHKLRFRRFGRGSRLVQTQVDGHARISIGSNVYVNRGGWLACMPLGDRNDPPTLRIGSGTYIGRYCHIYSTGFIEIGKKVLIADKVYIADNLHGYEDVERPVIDQPVRTIHPVWIGDGAWLGENVCVIGARVGRNAVVAANAVVTRDIPDFCVAAGIPAVIIKRYDPDRRRWGKTDAEGKFI
jgi:acetyltransferase-like isoleucine patch superfamily enzyme